MRRFYSSVSCLRRAIKPDPTRPAPSTNHPLPTLLPPRPAARSGPRRQLASKITAQVGQEWAQHGHMGVGPGDAISWFRELVHCPSSGTSCETGRQS